MCVSMLCKEDLLLWFKDLDSDKRVDILYSLLHMCIPFELRFLGNCLEEMGKPNYLELRGPALAANDYEKLLKDTTLCPNLLLESIRHRLLVCLSLLSSRNYKVANLLYRKCLKTECIDELIQKNSINAEGMLMKEFMLLYTMAIHHPAFSFDHKMFFQSVLIKLVNYKEQCRRSAASQKPPSCAFPPGFGYAVYKPPQNVPDNMLVSLKHNLTVPYSDLPKGPLPNLHPMGQSSVDFTTAIWNRPGSGIHCGAPEVPPFSTSLSPLVSQSGTPTHNRSDSPPRTGPGNLRLPLNNRPPPIESITPVQINSLDPLAHSSLPNLFGNSNDLKRLDDELINPQEGSRPPLRNLLNDNLKPSNGIVYQQYTHKLPVHPPPVPYLTDALQLLNLDGDNSPHGCNSSSSDSSLNQSPPDTPIVVTPDGSGRTDKPRTNGLPQQQSSATNFINNMPPLCDTTPPPPPPLTASAFNNCSVPYTNYPASFNQIPPNRSLFQYNHPQAYCRSQFSPFPSYQNPDNTIPYTIPYVSILYSTPPYPPRPPTGCYNCGSANHVGVDCLAQTIDEITEKKSYTLDFNDSSNDADN